MLKACGYARPTAIALQQEQSRRQVPSCAWVGPEVKGESKGESTVHDKTNTEHSPGQSLGMQRQRSRLSSFISCEGGCDCVIVMRTCVIVLLWLYCCGWHYVIRLRPTHGRIWLQDRAAECGGLLVTVS